MATCPALLLYFDLQTDCSITRWHYPPCLQCQSNKSKHIDQAWVSEIVPTPSILTVRRPDALATFADSLFSVATIQDGPTDRRYFAQSYNVSIPLSGMSCSDRRKRGGLYTAPPPLSSDKKAAFHPAIHRHVRHRPVHLPKTAPVSACHPHGLARIPSSPAHSPNLTSLPMARYEPQRPSHRPPTSSTPLPPRTRSGAHGKWASQA